MNCNHNISLKEKDCDRNIRTAKRRKNLAPGGGALRAPEPGGRFEILVKYATLMIRRQTRYMREMSSYRVKKQYEGLWIVGHFYK